jgi:lipopolysaccharide export system permease protein
MSIIDRYLTLEILKYFSIILFTVVFIFLAVDFFEKIDNFISAGVPLSRIIIFFQFRVPFLIVKMTPVGLLLAILITFGLMSKHNELVALRSGGVSALYLLRSVLTIGLAASALLFFMAEEVVPITIDKANRIWTEEVKKTASMATENKNIWIKEHRFIAHIKHYDRNRRTIAGITLYWFDEKFRLRRRVDAASGSYAGGNWVLQNLMEQVRNDNTEDPGYTVKVLDRLEVSLAFAPEDLKQVVKKSEEMNFMELLDYIRAVEDEGYDATAYRVDLYAKIAFPLVCLILAILAVGFGLRRRAGETLSVSVAYGIGVTFLYWVFYSFCLTLGYGGVLPSFVAAWAADVVFFSLGLYLLLIVDY